MMHLPLGHTCPACGGPHRPERSELPAASQVRPYFGTFINVSGSVQTPVTISGTLDINTPGGGQVWSGGQLTISKTGHWFAYFFHQPNSGNTGWFHCYMRIAGGQVGPYFQFYCSGGNQSTYSGGAEFDATINQGFDIYCPGFGGSNGSSAGGSVKLVFCPTPSYK